MKLKLVECKEKYWEFIRQLRTDSSNQLMFFTSVNITEEEQHTYMTTNAHKYKVCLKDNEPVGYIALSDRQEISYCVSREHRGKGIGTFMVQEIDKVTPNIKAFVKDENKASQRVFEKLGYRKTMYYEKNN